MPALPGLERLLGQRGKLPISALTIERRILRGGLEALHTEDVMARFVDGAGRRHSFRFVAKHLGDRSAREAQVYRSISALRWQASAPRLLACEQSEGNGQVLYLEPILPAQRWPWADVQRTGDVLQLVASFHASARETGLSLPGWNYEGELALTAQRTLERLAMTRRFEELSCLRRGFSALERLVNALPRLRRELLASSFGSNMIHGDLHSGNVLVRRRARGLAPVLLDWGRARDGSPLEDVSSWLQSLRCWEPEALRRHDTLLSRYLIALGRSATITGETRESYWLSAVSNLLAGALEYHLTRAQTAHTAAERAHAAGCARDALRVVRRADTVWS